MAAVLAVGAGAWAVGRVGSATTNPSTGDGDTAVTGQPGTADGIGVSAFDAAAVDFDLETGQVLESQRNDMGGIATTPDGRIIAVHTDTGIELFDMDQDRWSVVPRGFDSPLTFAFVPNGGG